MKQTCEEKANILIGANIVCPFNYKEAGRLISIKGKQFVLNAIDKEIEELTNPVESGYKLVLLAAYSFIRDNY